MEGYIAEIRGFAGTFAPVGWMFCAGQILSINNYQTLYVLIGTTYGGDGVNTFVLPDLRGRVPIGAGPGPGLTNVVLGQVIGTETVTLLPSHLPTHTHSAAVNATSVPFAVKVSPAAATLHAAATNSQLGQPMFNSTSTLGYNSAIPDKKMSDSSLNTNGLTVTTTRSGGSLPHENMQPFLTTNYIICVEGIFPSRN
ncbi:Phage Tail Collar Domain [Sphingobacterium spiritivorum]|uniref:Phage Tail Collar Domain n=1 Tax=Sphingobacterium spiritivorum TaxID=258 RepID=A0A380BIX5_SPHSI|nr:tail fiber protein [Sphingobacterium spiritivorum]SUJ01332.1 Phage Tail Collar Domain [Sphingobacterium spiritivorum]